MKKKTLLISFVSLSALCAFAVSFLPKKYEPLSADSPYTYIGKSFKYEHVSSLTKVYCLGQYYQYALAAGREVYSELSGGGLLGGQNDPLALQEYEIDYSLLDEVVGSSSGTLSLPLVRYYYYATPSLPKIVDCHDMYNDPSSVVFALEILEDEAEHLEISDVKNAVLSYVRCINTSYTGDDWEKVAGDFEEDLINSFATFTVGGVEINEFFASFISNEYYNTDYGTCRTSYLNYNLPFIDCYEKGSDLIHMFASIDGIFEGTVDSYVFPLDHVDDEFTIRFLASWVGDLQTAAIDIKDRNLSNYDFEDILGDPDSSFGYHDFYADVNAINIAGGIDLDDIDSISSAISSYFISTLESNPFFSRIGNFMDVVCSMTFNNSLTFKNIIYCYLGIDMNGNCIIDYNLINIDHHVKYRILGLTVHPFNNDPPSFVPSPQLRKYLADEFWYYCNLHRNYYDN